MREDLKKQIKEWKRQRQEVKGYGKKKRRHGDKKDNKEHLTERDIKELMGIGATIMRRGKGGAWRNGR